MSANRGASHDLFAAPRRPGGFARVTWPLVAALLLGPPLSLALGPRLLRDRVPLFEASIRWQGAAPAADEWAHPRRPGESVSLRAGETGEILVARAPGAGAAEALARELAFSRLGASPELTQRRAQRRAGWVGTILEGPTATLSAAGDCAARLRGWGEAWRTVAGIAAPVDDGGAPLSGAPAMDLGSLAGVRSRVARLALATDPEALEGALAHEARLARGLLFTDVGSMPPPRRTVAVEAWRHACVRRAAELDLLADALELKLKRIERELVSRVAPQHALAAEPRIPDPDVVLLAAASGLEPAAAQPWVAVWIALGLAGALAVGAVAWPIAVLAARARFARREALLRRRRSESAGALAARERAGSESSEDWLQIVSGARAVEVTRAVRELAARSVARRERVLVVDGARRLRLHRGFGARPRLGFQECMRGELPVLGVVQSGGLPGLFVLAHGSPERVRSWMALDRVLDQARPHFDRVVLALDADVSSEAGKALSGMRASGWWAAADGGTSKRPQRFSERIGITLAGMDLPAPAHASLEQRVADLAEASAREDVGAGVRASHPEPELPGLVPALTVEPMVLDCDLRVRDRLRFLMSRKRLRAEEVGDVQEPAVSARLTR